MKTGKENAAVGEIRLINGQMKKLTITTTGRDRWVSCDEQGETKLGKPRGTSSTGEVDLTSLLKIIGGEKFAKDISKSMTKKGYSGNLNQSILVGTTWAKNRGYVIKPTEENLKVIEVRSPQTKISRSETDVEIEGTTEVF